MLNSEIETNEKLKLKLLYDSNFFNRNKSIDHYDDCDNNFGLQVYLPLCR